MLSDSVADWRCGASRWTKRDYSRSYSGWSIFRVIGWATNGPRLRRFFSRSIHEWGDEVKGPSWPVLMPKKIPVLLSRAYHLNGASTLVWLSMPENCLANENDYINDARLFNLWHTQIPISSWYALCDRLRNRLIKLGKYFLLCINSTAN